MDSLEVEWVSIAFRCMCSQSPGQAPPRRLLWKRHKISSQIKQPALQPETPWPGLGVLDPRANMEKFRRGQTGGQRVLWLERSENKIMQSQLRATPKPTYTSCGGVWIQPPIVQNWKPLHQTTTGGMWLKRGQSEEQNCTSGIYQSRDHWGRHLKSFNLTNI